MSDDIDNKEAAFRVLVRVLEGAVRARSDSIGLKYEGQDLVVCHYFGCRGVAAAMIPKEMQQVLIEEIVKRAGLACQPQGVMQVKLLGENYDVKVDAHEEFGEPTFNLTLKASNKRAQGFVPFGLEKLTEKKATEMPSVPPAPLLAQSRKSEGKQKIGRNDPSPCGSGKKYKVCCLKKQQGY